jgi:predicted dehydrogenase
MVGGAIGSFIGPVHRMAAELDGQAEFIAGAFSSSPEKSKKTGKSLFMDPCRVYSNYKEMAAEEAKLPADERIDWVTIVTPNNSHADIVKTFLKAGINVICDKSMAFSLAQAKEMRKDKCVLSIATG